jgi:hypothetical protein
LDHKKSKHLPVSLLNENVFRRLAITATLFFPDEFITSTMIFTNIPQLRQLNINDLEKLYQTLFPHSIYAHFVQFFFDFYGSSHDNIVSSEQFIKYLDTKI